jgi:hypothetical protein
MKAPIALLPLALACPQQPAQDPLAQLFLPRLEHGSRPASEWLDRLRAPRDDADRRDALWCLYWQDDRGALVIDALRALLRPSADERRLDLSREADAILDDWGVEHECLSLEEYWTEAMTAYGGWYRTPAEVHDWPMALLDLSDDELIALLDSDSEQLQARAAVTLVAGHRHAERAIRALLRAAHQRGSMRGAEPPDVSPDVWRIRDLPAESVLRALAWARSYAGTAADDAIASLLADPAEPLERKRFVLADIGVRPMKAYRRRTVAELPLELARLVVEGGELADLAWRQLSALCDVPCGSPWDEQAVQGLDESWVHIWKELPPLEDPLLVGPFIEALRARIERSKARGPLTLRDLADGVAAALMCPAARAVVLPELHALTDREDARLDALRALCHLGAGGPRIEALYLRCLAGWKDPRAGSLERLPCLEHHSPETLAALERFIASRGQWPPFRTLEAGGLLGGDPGPLALAYAEHLQESGTSLWDSLYEAGYRGPAPLDGEDDPLDYVAKLGITIRARQRAGEPVEQQARALWEVLQGGFHESGTSAVDFYSTAIRMTDELGLSSPAFHDYCLTLLLDRWKTFGYHQLAAAHVLWNVELSPRQRAILCHMDVDVLCDDWDELLGRQGRAAIERVTDVRAGVYCGSVRGLRDVLRITRLSQLDERYLLGALGRGSFGAREAALEVVREGAVDFPAVRAAVRRRETDCDAFVRSAARALVEARSW